MKKISLSMTASLIAIAGILLIIYFLSSGKAVKSSYSYGIILPDSDTALGGIFSSLHVQDLFSHTILAIQLLSLL